MRLLTIEDLKKAVNTLSHQPKSERKRIWLNRRNINLIRDHAKEVPGVGLARIEGIEVFEDNNLSDNHFRDDHGIHEIATDRKIEIYSMGFICYNQQFYCITSNA